MGVGKVYFAWVSAGELFDAQVHAREDEQVFAINIVEREGEFATASVTILNPRVGLLAPARRQRAFISADVDGQVRLLFSGRVVGVPANITGETIELEFIARPDDHAQVQSAFLDRLKGMPQYHEALLSDEERNDISVVLEGFSGLPHWDRVTGALSLAPIANTGAQAVRDLSETILDGSLDVSFTSAPVNAVTLSVDVFFTQNVPVVTEPFRAFEGYGAQGRLTSVFGGRRPQTLTPDDFMSRWPAPGTSLDGGWSVVSGWLEPRTVGQYDKEVSVSDTPPRVAGWTAPTYAVSVPVVEFDGHLLLAGFYEQPRREILTVTVSSDLQPLVEFPEPEHVDVTVDGVSVAPLDTLTLSASFQSPSSSGGYSGQIRSWSTRRRDLTSPTLSGSESMRPVIVAAVARAEALLRKSARCVTVKFEAPLNVQTLSLTTADVVRVADDRLPGGYATGKVSSIEIVLDGDGAAYCAVEMACSVGRAATAASPSVLSHGVASSDVPYEPGVVTRCRTLGVDDGTFAIAASVRNSVDVQKNALDVLSVTAEISRYASYGYRWAQVLDDQSARQSVEEALAERPTEVLMSLVSLEAADETTVPAYATLSAAVQICRDINLEA